MTNFVRVQLEAVLWRLGRYLVAPPAQCGANYAHVGAITYMLHVFS